MYGTHPIRVSWCKNVRTGDDLCPAPTQINAHDHGSFMTADSYQFHIEVKHHCPPPNWCTWETRATHGLAVEELRVQFGSWEEASQAGKHAHGAFLATSLCRCCYSPTAAVDKQGAAPVMDRDTNRPA